MRRDPLRAWVTRNLHIIVFLGTYLLATVAGNLIFATPLADESLRRTGLSPRFLQFANTFTFGYWLLLFCPFIVTPFLVMATRRVFRRPVESVARALPEFTRLDYAIIVFGCLGYVIYEFWAADVPALFISGADPVSSVEARFTIRERLGFFPFVPLQALMPFLTVYALLRWMHSREPFWLFFAGLDFLVVSVLLVMINMKWPVILFDIGLVLTIFVYATKRAYLKTAIGAAFTIVMFLLVSTFVFRLAPREDTNVPVAARTEPTATAVPAPSTKEPVTRGGDTAVPGPAPAGGPARPAPNGPSDTPETKAPDANVSVTSGGENAFADVLVGRLVATAQAADDYAPTILLQALNRMAISYPYYYQVFTDEGAVCGGVWAQARRNPSCRPSALIYVRLFGNDGFQNRGTSGQGVHISGYALGGWPVALLALFAGAVILGVFSALPLDHGPAVGAIVILGALAAYHLSQVPGEGVIIYDHGLLWTSLLILGYWAWRRLASTAGLTRPAAAPTTQQPL